MAAVILRLNVSNTFESKSRGDRNAFEEKRQKQGPPCGGAVVRARAAWRSEDQALARPDTERARLLLVELALALN
jgi:hypothetical protein